jgi:hypothetical protein
MTSTNALSPALEEWKKKLESDSRNPIRLEDLQWQLPQEIRLNPLYDAGSLGPEHAYLKDFHQHWKQEKPMWKPVFKVSALPTVSLSENEIAEAEKLGFVAWSGIPAGGKNLLPAEPEFQNDPIVESLCAGKWTNEYKKLMEEQNLNSIQIHASAFHNAGANAIEDLAFALLVAEQYRSLIGNERFSELAANATIHLGTSTSFFLEIARFRTMRLLWMNFCDKNGAGKPAGNIQGETSLLTWSHSDPDTNLLRHTSSMMSAILGGADSILAHPHTLDPALASDAIRQSVNIGHLALEEAHLGDSFDPGSGSYLIEILSHELAQQAWKLFCKWQEMPFVNAVESGFFAKTAEASAEILKEKYSSGKLVMTGVNRHPSDLARKSPAFPKQNQSETDFPALKTFFLDA